MNIGRLLLIRHGETTWNREGRYQGNCDVRLSEEGIRQAQKLAKFLQHESLEAVYSSDLQRASATAQIIAEPHGLPVHLDPRLREYRFGIWEGLTQDEIKVRYPQLWEERAKDYMNTRIPGGELPHEVFERVMACLTEICLSHTGTVAVVFHGGSMRQAIQGMGSTEAFPKDQPIRIPNTGMITVEWTMISGKPSFLVKGIEVAN